jgi:amino acid adenylation domain-containing protein
MEPPRPAHEEFVRQAKQIPDAIAIIGGGNITSYGELDQWSDSLAVELGERGFTRKVIAVYGERTAWLACAILGIMKAGAVFTVMDPAYPAPRLIDCMHASQPAAWLEPPGVQIQRPLEQFITSLKAKIQWIPPGRPVVSCPQSLVGADEACYIAYTSGTTGRPKAVLGTHGPVAHFVKWSANEFGFRASDRFSMLSGLAHDPLLRDLLCPLQVGGTLCIPDAMTHRDPGMLSQWLRDNEVTVSHMTPQLLRTLVDVDEGARWPDLRYAFLGGDILTEPDVAALARAAPRARVVNYYGTTETPQAIAFRLVESRTVREGVGGRVPIGHGIEGAQLLVINDSGRQAAVGEVGEIYVRSPYLTTGYLGNDRLSGERFVTNPFSGDPTDRMYRTGDLGRYQTDGDVDILGRADGQVKIRGFRVEPEEVRVTLERNPRVRACVVRPRQTSNGDETELVAYVVLRTSATNDQQKKLRDYIAARLPSYLVPSSFVFMDALPLTPNGKLDLDGLPVPVTNKGFVAANEATGLEDRLASIWAELLGHTSIGPDDDFFSLGGHSLTVMRLIAQTREAFNVELPMRAVFDHPTLRAQAACIRALIDSDP